MFRKYVDSDVNPCNKLKLDTLRRRLGDSMPPVSCNVKFHQEKFMNSDDLTENIGGLMLDRQFLRSASSLLPFGHYTVRCFTIHPKLRFHKGLVVTPTRRGTATTAGESPFGIMKRFPSYGSFITKPQVCLTLVRESSPYYESISKKPELPKTEETVLASRWRRAENEDFLDVIFPLKNLSTLDKDTVSHYVNKIKTQQYLPTALLLGATCCENVRTHWILDGHYKIYAAMLNDSPCNVVSFVSNAFLENPNANFDDDAEIIDQFLSCGFWNSSVEVRNFLSQSEE